ncbi:MAG: ribosome small subunit-dependent GTPase A [Bacteroidetes bacterium]|nr:MAG: ribosome small subunit-dependent GTPase A [Bacteroidota bacterium]
MDYQKGVVVRSTGSWYMVLSETGEKVDCKIKGRFRIKGIRATNPVAVGDVVDFHLSVSGDGVITRIHERKNYIIRKATNLSKATHIIASNLDQAIVIVSLVMPRTSTGFIDRFLVTAEAYHIPVFIIFNKYDLYDEKVKGQLVYYVDVYQGAGYNCLVTSVPDRLHLEDFREILHNRKSLLVGHSGVGKSALINAIDPKLNLKEGQISEYHEKGKHTTTFAEMLELGFGGYIIDTPGIKEFGLVEFEKEELGQRFPEMRQRMHNCRFNDCLHVDEPGCAVLSALEKGEIAEFRYLNYLNMLGNLTG